MPTVARSLKVSNGVMDHVIEMSSAHTGTNESMPKKMESPMQRWSALPSTKSPTSQDIGVGISTQKEDVSEADPQDAFIA